MSSTSRHLLFPLGGRTLGGWGVASATLVVLGLALTAGGSPPWRTLALTGIVGILALRLAATRRALAETRRQLRAEARRCAELSDQLDFLRRLVDTSPNLLFAKDRQGVFRFANRAVAEVYGTDVEGLVGRTDADFNPDLAEVDHFLEDDRRVIDGQLEHFIAEEKVTGADGKTVWLQTIKRPLQAAGGGGLLCFGAATDITRRVEAETALEDARARAEEASRAKSAFLANISHEIRTPLNGILGLTEILAGSELDALQHSHLGLVRSASRSLKRLLDDVLLFSRLEAGQERLELVRFDPTQCFRDLLEDTRLASETAEVALVDAISPDLPGELVGDPVRLRQVVGNLLDNALKFTQEGEVSLAVEAGPVREGRVALEVAVADDGIGIAPDDVPRLLERFHQVDGSTARRAGGAGLGLAIVDRIVRAMGGELRIDSAPGQGSTFRFEVELEVPQAAQGGHLVHASSTPALARLREPGEDPIRVLLVEDTPINQVLATALLERMGCTTTLAERGSEALRLLAEQSFDVVLMDVHLPELDGYETTRRIRAQEAGTQRRVPIVAVTACAMDGDRERCLEAGMDAYLSKPIRPAELAEAVRWAVDERAGSPG